MERQSQPTDYAQAIKTIKTAILPSCYRATKSVNKEVLSLFYGVGEYISSNSRKGFWGTSAINVISQQLQPELSGLRGYSESNIKNMRIFYEARLQHINRQLSTDDLKKEEILATGFTHHILIIARVKDIAQRFFYIKKCATEFWSVEKLKYYLKGYLIKWNFYFSALDEYVKILHKNSSIGISCASHKAKIPLILRLEIPINRWVLQLLKQPENYLSNMKVFCPMLKI